MAHDILFPVLTQNVGDDHTFSFSYDDFMTTLQTNVVGPAYLSQVLYPLLEKSSRKTIVNYSSGLGSIGSDYGPKSATYSVSKAAINMLVRSLPLPNTRPL